MREATRPEPGSVTTFTVSRATCYLGWGERQHWPLAERWAVRGEAARHYLEAMELEWDWLEEVVAALSWENPLWLDSRLVMEPLKSSEPITSV